MADTTTTPRTTDQLDRAWTILERLYCIDPQHPLVAGARAAAEWTSGRAPVSPVTLERIPPTLNAARNESHNAAMVEMGIRPGDGTFARGVSAWMFWWTGVGKLPGWLRA